MVDSALRRSPTGRAQLFARRSRAPCRGGPRPASRDPSRERRATVAESATRPRPRPTSAVSGREGCVSVSIYVSTPTHVRQLAMSCTRVS
eukprot:358053-Chlamydomonas_euryale.AAC.4